MCRKLIYLVCFVLVLSLVSSASVASAAEPINRYSFIDGDTGAVDSVSGRDGTLLGAAVITGNQLDCGGIGSVNLPGDILDPGLVSVTIEAWFTINTVTSWQRLFDFGETDETGAGGNCLFYTPTSGAGDSRFVIGTNGIPSWQTGELMVTASAIAVDTPTHIACVYDGSVPELRLYQDAVWMGTTAVTDPHNLSKVARMFAYIGDAVYTPDPYLNGSVDEFRIYDTALTDAEVLDSFNAGPNPGKASNPYPSYGETIETQNVTLSWTPGADANKHDVYFGTDINLVHDANRDNELGVLVSKDQDANNYPVTGLETGVTHYWRIDEVNGVNIWRGDIWNFSVKPLKAHNPSPPDEYPYAPFPDPNVWLRWTPGLFAASTNGHQVYLDTDDQKVIDRSGCAVDGVSTTDPCYYIGDVGIDLDFNQTYFWAVDEVNSAGPDPCLWSGDVWTFTTEPNILVLDPNLLAWWTFDKAGPLALDMSGYRKHGTLLNDPCWTTEGTIGGALRFDGEDDYVDLPIGEDINSLTSSTYMVWVDFNTTADSWWPRIFDFGSDACDPPQIYMFLSPRIGSDGVMRFCITPTGWGGEDITDGVVMTPGWHHLAVTIDACDPGGGVYTTKLYLDGSVVGETTDGDVLPKDLGVTPNNWLGRSQYAADDYFNGTLDDLRIYDYTLTEQEIEEKLNPLKAWKPSPVPGATVPILNPTLTWRAGKYAASMNGHLVYFDPNDQKVIDRSGCEVNGVSTDDPCYPIPGPLELGLPYYWAVDEVNSAGPDPCLWPGDLWYFNVSPALIVEDFDSYVEDADLRAVWKDYYTQDPYTSAEVYVETGVEDANLVQDGNSMRYWYRNNLPPYYSEADADTADLPSQIGSDWTTGDVKALVLDFYGQSGNDANEQMYVKLHDADSNAVVTYGDYGEDPNDLRVEEWQEWNIDLEDFNSAGVDLTNVTRITIGFGDGSEGGAGTVYFEDIRLYPPRCVSSLRKPAGDLDNDCDFDYDDLEAMTRHWLIADYNADPLIAWYKLDDGSGTTAADSSAYGNHGTLVGDPQWVGGHIGGALDFNGVNDYVDCGNDVSLDITDAVTLTAWVDTNDSGNSDFNPYVAKGDHSYGLQHNINDGIEFFIYDDNDGTWYAAFYAVDSSFNDEWHHLAGTYDGGQLKLYIDGVLEVTTDHVGTMGSRTFTVEIGRSSEYTDRLYNGLIDDVRVYDKALSQAEIASIMDGTLGSVSHYHPVPSPAELYKAEAQGSRVVNFRDFAIMAADRWLEEPLLWP